MKTLILGVTLALTACSGDTPKTPSNNANSNNNSNNTGCTTIAPSGAFRFAHELPVAPEPQLALVTLGEDFVTGIHLGDNIFGNDNGDALIRFRGDGTEVWRHEFRGRVEHLVTEGDRLFAYVDPVVHGEFQVDDPISVAIEPDSFTRITFDTDGNALNFEPAFEDERRSSETGAYYALRWKAVNEVFIERVAENGDVSWSVSTSRQAVGGTVELLAIRDVGDGVVAAFGFPRDFTLLGNSFEGHRRHVIKLDPDGEFVWGRTVVSGKMDTDFRKSFHAYDGDFFIYDHSTLHRIDGDTGELVWEVEVPQAPESRAAIFEEGLLTSYGESNVDLDCAPKGQTALRFDLDTGAMSAVPVDIVEESGRFDFWGGFSGDGTHYGIGKYYGPIEMGNETLPPVDDLAYFFTRLN